MQQKKEKPMQQSKTKEKDTQQNLRRKVLNAAKQKTGATQQNQSVAFLCLPMRACRFWRFLKVPVKSFSIIFSLRFLHRFLVAFWTDFGAILGRFWEPSWRQNRTKNRPKIDLRPQTAPRPPKSAPRPPQESPRDSPKAPKSTQKAAKSTKKAPKSPEASQI